MSCPAGRQDELELKTKVWVEMNREYIEAQAAKDAARREAEAAGLEARAEPSTLQSVGALNT